jgi:hypothetical protein
VSTESLYGAFLPEANAAMTLPSADSDMLILAPSLSRSPVAPVDSARSDPARCDIARSRCDTARSRCDIARNTVVGAASVGTKAVARVGASAPDVVANGRRPKCDQSKNERDPKARVEIFERETVIVAREREDEQEPICKGTLVRAINKTKQIKGRTKAWFGQLHC